MRIGRAWSAGSIAFFQSQPGRNLPGSRSPKRRAKRVPTRTESKISFVRGKSKAGSSSSAGAEYNAGLNEIRSTNGLLPVTQSSASTFLAPTSNGY